MARENAADVGLIGLGVMGQNLALNMADHGYRVAVFNRTSEVMKHFVAKEKPPGGLVGCESLEELVAAVAKPRRIIILVKAGAAVDTVTQQLLDAGVEPDDIVVDCGNSLWTDTIRREKEYGASCKFFGSGVSGGELGARFGASMMPGGDPDSWKHLEPIWKDVAAKVDAKTGKPIEDYAPGKPVTGGVPCTTYLGPNGAGHYVKMVHNGIEYIDMQLISEAYTLLASLLGMKPPELSQVFGKWNEGDLDSYLIEITRDIFAQHDPVHPEGYLVDYVLDSAGQKGTGKWTSVNALDMGIPASSIAEAVFARFVSALKDERMEASKRLKGPPIKNGQKRDELVGAIRDALYCSKICAYAQGFQMLREAQKEYGWSFDFAALASIFRGGCIIRARFLQKIMDAYARDNALVNLLFDPYFGGQIEKLQGSWRKVVALAATSGIAAPAFMSALSYYDGYRAARSPASLLQAQRDYFGAHTYERTDAPRGKFFHLDWPAPGRPQVEVRPA